MPGGQFDGWTDETALRYLMETQLSRDEVDEVLPPLALHDAQGKPLADDASTAPPVAGHIDWFRPTVQYTDENGNQVSLPVVNCRCTLPEDEPPKWHVDEQGRWSIC